MRREPKPDPPKTHAPALLPMKATPTRELPRGAGWTYEPKYDGIRIVAFAAGGAAALTTSNGNDTTRAFPEVCRALAGLVADAGRPVVLDGELVALAGDEPGRFPRLQGRMHARDPRTVAHLAATKPVALFAFDLLVDGDDVLLHQPWRERRRRLEAVLAGREGRALRLVETTPDAGELLARARAGRWEGVVAKRTDGAYRPGTRSDCWLKLKLEDREELVVGGWTDPAKGAAPIGSLLVGHYTPDGRFVYAGHVGTGFTRAALAELARRLRPLERKTPPFAVGREERVRAHWATPRVVVEVEYNGLSRTGKLRQASFEGLRDDKDAREVVRDAPEPDAADT